MIAAILSCIVLLLSSWNSSTNVASGYLTLKPRDAEVRVGRSTYFNCSTSDLQSTEIVWFHYGANSSLHKSVLCKSGQLDSRYHERFQMDTDYSTGTCNLIIPEVKLEDAGIYECQDENGAGEKSRAKLIVIAEEGGYNSLVVWIPIALVVSAAAAATAIGVYLSKYRRRGNRKVKDKYKRDPVLIRAIETEAIKYAPDKSIFGLTILGRELYVVHGTHPAVEVYDSKRLNFSRRFELTELLSPYDIGSCNKSRCLYIMDLKDFGKPKTIMRIKSNGQLVGEWSTADDEGQLSVTAKSNIILTVSQKNKLNEYSPDGQLIREIKLSRAGLSSPWHSIKLATGEFVVSHSGVGDCHGVCLVDAEGTVKKSFGGKSGSNARQLKYPVYLAIDRDGFILVSDYDNGRVLLLDSEFELKRDILSKERHELQYPSRICLQKSRGRLFVAEIGKVLAFKVK